MNNKNPRLSLAAASLLLLALSLDASAEWTIDPTIRAGVETDDNARLDARTDLEVDVSGYLVEAIADMTYATDRTDFSFTPRFLARFYDDEPDLESNDLFLRSTLVHRMQSSAFGMRVNYGEQKVRTAEISDNDLDLEDPDEIPGDTTGAVRLSGDRVRWFFTPYWEYSFSDVTSFLARVDYTDVSYDDLPPGTLSPYTDARLTLSLRRAFSERSEFLFNLSGRTFDSENSGGEDITGTSFTAGISTELSETTRLRTSIGLEDTDAPGEDVDPQVIGDVTLTRRLETIFMFAQYRRSANGNGGGRVSIRDQLNVNFSRRLTEKISVGLGVRAYQTESIGDVVSSIIDREQVQLRAETRWFVNNTFSIEASYNYTVLDRGAALDGRANSNRINLWFVYQPNRRP